MSGEQLIGLFYVFLGVVFGAILTFLIGGKEKNAKGRRK